MEAGEAGDASLRYSSFLWVAGWFQARFHWLLEAVDDVLYFFCRVSPCGVACEVLMVADDSLCRDLWEGWVLGRGPS